MIEQQWGRIINFTGLAAVSRQRRADRVYRAGNGGADQGIAREYGKYNITANCSQRQGMENEEKKDCHFRQAHGSNRSWGTPEELAFLAVSLASEEAGYVTGQCVLANGGNISCDCSQEQSP